MAVERYVETAPERLPPHNTAAEEAVLGSILIDPEALNGVAPLVRAEDFYRSRTALIYGAMLTLHDRREPVDYLTLADELQREDKYEEIGGLPYLASLLSVVPTAAFAEHYARIIERTAVMRRNLFDAGFDYSVDLTSFEDWMLYRRLRAAGRYGRIVPRTLLTYRVRATSMLRSLTTCRLKPWAWTSTV